MSYRCQPCGAHVGGPMRRHVVRRRNGQIARETPVCDACAAKLLRGEQLAQKRTPPPLPRRNVKAPSYEEPIFGEN